MRFLKIGWSYNCTWVIAPGALYFSLKIIVSQEPKSKSYAFAPKYFVILQIKMFDFFGRSNCYLRKIFHSFSTNQWKRVIFQREKNADRFPCSMSGTSQWIFLSLWFEAFDSKFSNISIYLTFFHQNFFFQLQRPRKNLWEEMFFLLSSKICCSF